MPKKDNEREKFEKLKIAKAKLWVKGTIKVLMSSHKLGSTYFLVRALCFANAVVHKVVSQMSSHLKFAV